eukprot:gene13036-15400_t
MVEVTIDTVTVPGGGDGGVVKCAVPLSKVEPTAKPHIVMEHTPSVHKSALTVVHDREAAPEGTLEDNIVRVVMFGFSPLIVQHVVAVLPVQ